MVGYQDGYWYATSMVGPGMLSVHPSVGQCIGVHQVVRGEDRALELSKLWLIRESPHGPQVNDSDDASPLASLRFSISEFGSVDANVCVPRAPC